MLKEMQMLDFHASYTYAPPTAPCVVNLDEVVHAVSCETRRQEPAMLVTFRDGSTLTVLGRPQDLLPEA